MKVILSRKGFDAVNGGHPSPILPDGKLVSLPIPQRGNRIRYSDLKFTHDGTYYDLMRQLFTKIKYGSDSKNIPFTPDTECHLDPDINQCIYKRLTGWKPLFGQVNAAQTHLDNQLVGEGDIFLFFGWFKKTKEIHGKIYFDNSDPDRHIIFGYFQIGEKFNPQTQKPPEWMQCHSHALPNIKRNPNNTIYIATSSLSWDSSLPGAGIFSYDKRRVLTKEGCSISKWQLPDFFKNVSISYHDKDSWNVKEGYFQSAYPGQEFVIQENDHVEKWAKELINNNVVENPRRRNLN